MSSHIRDYIRTQVLAVDSDMIEHDEPLLTDNIPQVHLQRAYQIIIPTSTDLERANSFRRQYDVTLRIFASGYNSKLANYDSLMCKAEEIADKVIDLKNIELSDIQDARNSNSINIEAIETDDNTYVANIQFTIITEYTR